MSFKNNKKSKKKLKFKTKKYQLRISNFLSKIKQRINNRNNFSKAKILPKKSQKKKL